MDEVAGGSSQSQVVQGEKEGAGRKRKRGMEGDRVKRSRWRWSMELTKLRTGSLDPGDKF